MFPCHAHINNGSEQPRLMLLKCTPRQHTDNEVFGVFAPYCETLRHCVTSRRQGFAGRHAKPAFVQSSHATSCCYSLSVVPPRWPLVPSLRTPTPPNTPLGGRGGGGGMSFEGFLRPTREGQWWSFRSG